MKKIKFFFNIFLSPLSFIFIPLFFFKTISNFISAKKFKFMGFDILCSLNNFFYMTQKFNLDIYGKHKKTPLLGFGDYHMSRLFYISRISHNIFLDLGPAFTTLLFSFLNIFICTIFYNNLDIKWLFLVIFFGYFSAITYSSSFTTQNYNLLSWFFFPIFIFSLINSNIYLLLLSISCLFLLSFSVGLYVFLFSILYILFIDFYYYYLIIFITFIIFIFIFPIIKSGLIKKWIFQTFLFVGISKKNLYSRSHQKFSKFNIYYTMVFLIPIIYNLYIKNDYYFLLIFPFLIFIINQFLFRFMDRENPIYAFLICIIIFTILNPKIINLLLLIFVANPIPNSLSILNLDKKNFFFNIRVFEPFDNYQLINEIKRFVRKVPKNSTVLFAYKNPRKNYDKIFDGYRNIVEVIYYYFQIRKVRSFPDWYAVWEEDKNKKIIWGRNFKIIQKNLKKIKTKYLVFYSENKQIFDNGLKKNFKFIADFSIMKRYINSNPLWKKKNKYLYFYLLEKK